MAFNRVRPFSVLVLVTGLVLAVTGPISCATSHDKDGPAGAGDQTGTLAAADQAMNRLHTATEDQELSTGEPGAPVSKAHYDYEARDRIHLIVDNQLGSSETYLIGNKRFDRQNSGPWSVEQMPGTDVVRWPDYHYATGASGVTVQGHEVVGGVDCLNVAFTLATFEYHFWIGVDDHLVRKYTMIAPQHVMSGTFSGFDEPRHVQPPI